MKLAIITVKVNRAITTTPIKPSCIHASHRNLVIILKTQANLRIIDITRITLVCHSNQYKPTNNHTNPSDPSVHHRIPLLLKPSDNHNIPDKPSNHRNSATNVQNDANKPRLCICSCNPHKPICTHYKPDRPSEYHIIPNNPSNRHYD